MQASFWYLFDLADGSPSLIAAAFLVVFRDSGQRDGNKVTPRNSHMGRSANKDSIAELS